MSTDQIKQQKAAYQREYRKRNQEKLRALGKRNYQKRREQALDYLHTRRRQEPWFEKCNIARDRSKKSGLEFDLTPEYIKSIWPADNKCPIFQVEFHKGERRSDWSASLDRINPNKGYVQGNVIIISDKANRIKSNATAQDIQTVADYFMRLS